MYFIKERKIYQRGVPEYEYWVYSDANSLEGPICMFCGNAHAEHAKVYVNWMNGNVLTVIPEISDPPLGPKARVKRGVIAK